MVGRSRQLEVTLHPQSGMRERTGSGTRLPKCKALPLPNTFPPRLHLVKDSLSSTSAPLAGSKHSNTGDYGNISYTNHKGGGRLTGDTESPAGAVLSTGKNLESPERWAPEHPQGDYLDCTSWWEDPS